MSRFILNLRSVDSESGHWSATLPLPSTRAGEGSTGIRFVSSGVDSLGAPLDVEGENECDDCEDAQGLAATQETIYDTRSECDAGRILEDLRSQRV